MPYMKRDVPMTRQEARNILQSLAHGIDPASGEIFPEQSPFNQPDVIRALFIAGEALAEAERRHRKEASSDGHAGQPWTEEEENRVKTDLPRGNRPPRSRPCISARVVLSARAWPGWA